MAYFHIGVNFDISQGIEIDDTKQGLKVDKCCNSMKCMLRERVFSNLCQGLAFHPKHGVVW